MKPYASLVVAILSEVLATSCLKETEGFARLLPSLLTVCGYGAAFYFLALALQAIPTGIAYAIWSGIGIVLVTIVAWLFQGQRPDAAAWGGMVLIVAGVIVLSLFSKSSVH